MTRIQELDALRGFCLIGIALGNVLWFSGVAVTHVNDPWSTDAAVSFALHMLVDGKFYALFALMFGASFVLMTDRERDRGRSPARLVRQRLGALGTCPRKGLALSDVPGRQPRNSSSGTRCDLIGG